MPSPALHIGVDFDNTIVCYDALFHRVARERNLIPADLPVNKSEVRNHLRRIGKEDAWTEMQGAVYGGRMSEAVPYPGVIEFFESCRRNAIRLSIVSHKTRRPFLGEQFDLHHAAMNWLVEQGFFDPSRIGLPAGSAFFELTRDAKLDRIVELGCTHFIDDLPEVFAEPGFPNIERILFDPGDVHRHETACFRAQNWEQIYQKISAPADGAVVDGSILEFVRQNAFSNAAKIFALPGGGNNRVFRVEDKHRDAVVKQYFQNPADPRDRFGAERAFYELVKSLGIQRTPEPLHWNIKERLGLLSFVEGRKLAAAEVDLAAVRQALGFVLEINGRRSDFIAAAVPPGSEACFSGNEHLECVERRVRRLDQISSDTEIDRSARAVVETRLRPAWEQIKGEIRREYDLTQELPMGQRVVSPSDFGFHNALQCADGRLRFIDFEYAGWDDPAKLICDFFCQPQLPVSLAYWDEFVGGLTRQLGLDPTLPQRARRLLPAYRIKWCCIMLNDFVRGDSARRDFAKGAASHLERKTAQLAKVRKALEDISAP